MSQIESTLSSVGSVAAATNADAGAINKLATADPSLGLVSTLVVLHGSSGGPLAVITSRGTPSEALPALTGAPGRQLADVAAHGGTDVVGLFGHGEQRRLAVAEGAPLVPGGYVVYGEIPLPEGTTLKSGFEKLQYALYDGRTTSSPVLVATTKVLPLTGQRVHQIVNLDDPNSSTVPRSQSAGLLFVVSTSGSLIGGLSDVLPWILGGLSILFGLVAAFVVEFTSRR
jgi:hypothetical protein